MYVPLCSLYRYPILTFSLIVTFLLQMQAEGGNAFALNPDVLMRTFRTNVVGPALVSQAFLPFLEKSEKKTILNISSSGGSLAIAAQVGTRNTSYAMSKAALNMLVRR